MRKQAGLKRAALGLECISLFLPLVCAGVCHSRLAIIPMDAPGAHGSDLTTRTLQAHLDGDADTLVFPARPGGWETGPLRIRVGGRVLIFLPGCVLRAKAGAFSSKQDCLLTIQNVENVSLIGYGASLVMDKREYDWGEWRHAISIRGSRKIRIEGLRIDGSGGDGIYLDGAPGRKAGFSSDIRVSHCRIRGHRRQGISVISVDGFILEKCLVEGTSGTKPSAGIDFEPDNDSQRISRCQASDCAFLDNAGPAMQAYFANLSGSSLPVSIGFKSCLFSRSDSGRVVDLAAFPAGMRQGGVTMQDCTFRNAGGPIVMVREIKADSCSIRITRSALEDARTMGGSMGASDPILHFPSGSKIWDPGTPGEFTLTGSRIRYGTRPIHDFGRMKGLKTGRIRVEAFLDGASSASATPGISYQPLSKAPRMPIGSPVVQEVSAAAPERTRPGGRQIRLGNWERDSLVYRQEGKWRPASWGAAITAKPGEVLRAVSFRGGVTSDTLVWTVPDYLGMPFAVQGPDDPGSGGKKPAR